jgi:ketosteroid isomerase-like protein
VSTEENKRISWRLQEEVFGQGKLKSVDELLAPDYVSHAPGDPELSRRTRGHQGDRARVPLGFPQH